MVALLRLEKRGRENGWSRHRSGVDKQVSNWRNFVLCILFAVSQTFLFRGRWMECASVRCLYVIAEMEYEDIEMPGGVRRLNWNLYTYLRRILMFGDLAQWKLYGGFKFRHCCLNVYKKGRNNQWRFELFVTKSGWV